MTPRTAPSLPALRLELGAPEQIEEAWSGPGETPPWCGRAGDGTVFAIEHGADGDMLFTYGEHARYRLDPSLSALQCAPSQDGLRWQQALLGRVLPNVSIARGYEALHASAVESPAGVVAIAAPSGTGKTTLALELTKRGWPLVVDDVLVLEDRAEGVLAHPGPPLANIGEDELGKQAAGEIGDTLGTLAGERWVALHETAREPRRVSLICLFERGPELRLEARSLPAGPLPLVPYMLGLKGDAERERRRFWLYANLASRAGMLELTCAPDDPPGAVASLVDQALESPRAAAPAGATP